MIQSFAASWELFHNTYLVGWAIALMLSLVGVIVVARDQIFIGAAVSQASGLGVAVALWLGSLSMAEPLSWARADGFHSAMAVAFAVAAAWVTTRGREVGHESHEAVTGWVFLLSSSLAILVVSRSPHGLDEIHRLLASSIIGATETDVWIFVSLSIATLVGMGTAQRPLLLTAVDPSMAEAVGLRLRAWTGGTSVWLGLAVGLSIHSSGMLYAFGCLVLPAMVAKNLCREVRSMLLVAPLVAVGVAALGFLLANHYDYPPAQMTVALLCGALPVAWLVRSSRSSGTRP